MDFRPFMTYELEQQIRETLNSIGLHHRDADVYIALCNLGSQPGSVIAKSLEMKRTTVYHSLQRLTDRGLIYPHKESSATFFCLNSMSDVISQLESEKEKLNKQQMNLQQISTALQQRLIVDKISKMKYREYRGTAELKRLKMSTLKKTNSVYIFASPGVLGLITAQKETAFWRRFENRAKRDGVDVRIIAPDNEGGKALEEWAKDKPFQLKIVPKEFLATSDDIEVTILDERIVVMGPLFGAEIQSKELAQLKKAAFELAWRGADMLAAGCSLTVTENDIPLMLRMMPKEES